MNIRKNLTANRTMIPAEWDSMVRGTPLPVVITKDNGDGTYIGHYDYDHMSLPQKIRAISL